MLYEVLLVLHPNFFFSLISCHSISPRLTGLSVLQICKCSDIKTTVHSIPAASQLIFLAQRIPTHSSRSTVNYHFFRDSFFESSQYVPYSSYQILDSLMPTFVVDLPQGRYNTQVFNY